MESLVTIVIPDLAGSAARTATLQALARHTPEPYEVVLLFVEETPRQRVPPEQNDQVIQQIALPAPFSTPAALNRLLTACRTPYILLLESGAIVTAGWLGKLLGPFNDPTVGLSGPSTNSSWNEQKVLTGSEGTGWSVKQIDAYAASVAKRYSNQWRPLDTLHSLGDFCYLFRRIIAEQLGGFDEAYGAGPCWEIDFNTRAARAGFRAMWVADAYVHRGPAAPWKVASVRHHFTESKQLYQDRFCGLRLQGKKTGYEPHCRGEACEHFAPRDLIQVTLQPGSKIQSPGEPFVHQGNNAAALLAGEKPGGPLSRPNSQLNILPKTVEEKVRSMVNSETTTPPISTNDMPRVSCIMPTRNRRAFLKQALTYFERQDYPNRELIIVDDGDDHVADLIPSDPRVRYVSLAKRTSIGAKRNLACEMAKGTIIAHWDDDDWYAPHRLSYQVAPLLAGKGDLTGLETSCFFDLSLWQAWTCSPELHRRLFVGDVHGGTLVYWRRVWERLARYPNASLAEDAFFLQTACRKGACLHKLPHAHSFVYLRHETNAWQFPLGTYLNPSGWQQADPNTYIPVDDLSFYTALSSTVSALAPNVAIDQADKIRIDIPHISVTTEHDAIPFVSCIMPTYNRRMHVARAIQYFQRQDYPKRELLILDDGSQSMEDLVPPDPRIRYVRLDTRMVLGAKRNLACQLAQGSIIVHWDDDDWSAPHRIRYQVEVLEGQLVDLCGARRLLFYEPAQDKAWLYEYPASMRRWLAGGTFCYRKALWAKNPFPEIEMGEDTRFIWSPRIQKATPVTDHMFYVALIHPGNTSPKAVNGVYWHTHPVEVIHSLLGKDLDFYSPQGAIKR